MRWSGSSVAPLVVLGGALWATSCVDRASSEASDAGTDASRCDSPVQCVEDCGEPPVTRCSCPAGTFPSSECGAHGEGIIAPQY